MTTFPTATAPGPFSPRPADPPELSLPEALRRLCETAADSLRVERVGVWLFVNGDKALRCVSLFERSRRRHSKGACLPLPDASAFVRAVSDTPLVDAALAAADPRTAELGAAYFAPHGITSVLDAPLMRDDRLTGVVCHEHVGPPRDWTDADRAFARSVADAVVAKMKSAEGGLRAAPKPPAGQPGEAAHEIRNALAEIQAHAELIGRTPGLPAGVAARLAKITAAVERGAAALRATPAAPATKADDGTGEYPTLPAGG